jgi:formate-dependent nitrite reductase membrane component NrfD
MSHTEPFQIRIGDLRERFRPQREWAEGRGLLLIVAHFLTGSGAGAWLVAVLLGLTTGLMMGFALVAIGAFFHLLFLGRPERFWRMMRSFGTSWISRGIIGVTLFLASAAFYLILALLGLGETTLSGAMLFLSVLGALWIVVYKGFVWASSKGIPLWNTPLVPVLYIAYALRGGTAVLMLLAAAGTSHAPLGFLEPIKLWLAVSTAVLVLIYIDVMRGSGMTALRSVNLMLFGRVALPFYFGALALGLIVPIAIGTLAYFGSLSSAMIALVGCLSLVGDLSIIYCIAKAGLYRPLPV